MDFPDKGQGQKPTPPREKKTPIVSGAVLSKRPPQRRLFNFLFAESPRTLGATIGKNIVMPRLKMALEESLNGFLSGMLWGDSTNRPLPNAVRQAQLRGQMTGYSAISTQGALQQAQSAVVQRPTSGNYDDVVLPTIQEAENLLVMMIDHLNQYNLVTVGDLYEWADLPVAVAHNGYGWTNLNSAQIKPVNGGFLLELPRPILL